MIYLVTWNIFKKRSKTRLGRTTLGWSVGDVALLFFEPQGPSERGQKMNTLSQRPCGLG